MPGVHVYLRLQSPTSALTHTLMPISYSTAQRNTGLVWDISGHGTANKQLDILVQHVQAAWHWSSSSG
jgi:hypothetical protein